MDEWTGIPFPETIETVRQALASTVWPVLRALTN